jgi:methionyl-tRNA formyltransferase
MSAPTAYVFAYADVGARCLEVLVHGGVDVRAVVTHVDDPAETRWFADVAEVARKRGLRCLTSAHADDDARIIELLAAEPVDFIFSFYFRRLLPARLLGLARRGALNMHGSLLPRYRGRAPINWAILRGESETGATLHYMVERADAGDIVDQQRVPIEIDDTAFDVSRKVTDAAAIVLKRSLPRLLDGTAHRLPQRALRDQYFGRRGPEDGRIDWSQPAKAIHDLVRAVAPPFPGAFTDIDGERWWIHATRLVGGMPSPQPAPLLHAHDGHCYIACVDGQTLEVRALANAQGPVDVSRLAAQLRPTRLS